MIFQDLNAPKEIFHFRGQKYMKISQSKVTDCWGWVSHIALALCLTHAVIIRQCRSLSHARIKLERNFGDDQQSETNIIVKSTSRIKFPSQHWAQF
ncbi:hypothetical protein RRG08_048389 [Elysia crispata]|uniref:Uncharacterized protein n=1 Tax=Elysia crispata TaxID=231223 RepID=A0AAE1B934_9GAST|nr:hypothetical protein RRG08_048389 [Elysia crispata]